MRFIEREAHRLKKAQALLQPGIAGSGGGIWADVGCGEGIFTYLLSTILPEGSEVYAIDKDKRALQVLKENLADDGLIETEFGKLSLLGQFRSQTEFWNEAKAVVYVRQADFTRPLSVPPLDGLLLANSLHFGRDKRSVLARLVGLLKLGGRLIVIEYNTKRGNYAVPYPLHESEFLTLVKEVGLEEGRILTKVPSTFLGEMYSGLAVKA